MQIKGIKGNVRHTAKGILKPSGLGMECTAAAGQLVTQALSDGRGHCCCRAVPVLSILILLFYFVQDGKTTEADLAPGTPLYKRNYRRLASTD